MGVAKVDYFGQTLIDLTNDTITPETLLKGITAHDANGDAIVGTFIGGGSDEWICEGGYFTHTGSTNSTTIPHNLGKIPDIFYVKMDIAASGLPSALGGTLLMCMFGISNKLFNNIENVGDNPIYKVVSFLYSPSTNRFFTSTFRDGFDTFTSDRMVYVTDKTISFGANFGCLATSYDYSWNIFAKK